MFTVTTVKHDRRENVCQHYYHYFTFYEFFTPTSTKVDVGVKVSSLGLQDSSQYSNRSQQTVIWMISIHLLISNSSTPLFKPLGTVPIAPTRIGITVTITFLSFFSSQARSKYLFIFSLSFIFTLWSQDDKLFFVFVLLIDSRSYGQD